MSLAEDVDLEEFITMKDDLSGADIKAVCTEAGLLALRERRMRVTKADFKEAREKVRPPFPVCSLCFVSHVACLGSVPQERGHTGGLILVDSHMFCMILPLFDDSFSTSTNLLRAEEPKLTGGRRM